MATIYTCGYTGRTPAGLRGLAVDHDALVVDIRYSPTSRVPHWREGALMTLGLGSDGADVSGVGFGSEEFFPLDVVTEYLTETTPACA